MPTYPQRLPVRRRLIHILSTRNFFRTLFFVVHNCETRDHPYVAIASLTGGSRGTGSLGAGRFGGARPSGCAPRDCRGPVRKGPGDVRSALRRARQGPRVQALASPFFCPHAGPLKINQARRAYRTEPDSSDRFGPASLHLARVFYQPPPDSVNHILANLVDRTQYAVVFCL